MNQPLYLSPKMSLTVMLMSTSEVPVVTQKLTVLVVLMMMKIDSKHSLDQNVIIIV